MICKYHALLGKDFFLVSSSVWNKMYAWWNVCTVVWQRETHLCYPGLELDRFDWKDPVAPRVIFSLQKQQAFILFKASKQVSFQYILPSMLQCFFFIPVIRKCFCRKIYHIISACSTVTLEQVRSVQVRSVKNSICNVATFWWSTHEHGLCLFKH